MRAMLVFLAGTILLSAGAAGAEKPDWAFPVMEKSLPPAPDDGTPKHLPGSDAAYTRAEIDDQFASIDWFPASHGPVPPIVAHGRPKEIRPCGLCHGMDGSGHPDNADLAGLPAGYIQRQLVAFRDGGRLGTDSMIGFARAISDDEIKAAAAYFSTLPRHRWIRVVESQRVPASFVARGNMRVASPGGGDEPIGARIIELPENLDSTLLRDPRIGFVAYVPPGSIEKGRVLVTSGGAGKTLPCAGCHGASLEGIGDIPHLAGRAPALIARQLSSIQTGARSGGVVELMKPVVAQLGSDDMLAISAYLASLDPTERAR